MATTSNNNALVPFHFGAFPVSDVFMYASKYLPIADMATSAQVSKTWNVFVKNQPIWAFLYDAEKIPHIIGRGPETIMEDFLFMAQRVYGAVKIRGCLGEFVRKVIPAISLDRFMKLKKANETMIIPVEPEFIFRRYEKELFDDLVKNGDFDPKAPENANPELRGLMIPYTTKNLKILAEHPLSKVVDGPVFRQFDHDVLEQCNSKATGVKVSIMEKGVPNQTRQKDRDAQINVLKKNDDEMVPLHTLLYVDVIDILRTGNCAHQKEGDLRWTYARTSDTVQKQGYHASVIFPVVIGGYNKDKTIGLTGLCVFGAANIPSPDYGAAAKMVAEGPQERSRILEEDVDMAEDMEIDTPTERTKAALMKYKKMIQKTNKERVP